VENHVLTKNEFDQRYKKGRILGEGSYGKVYEGYDRVSKQKVAIKEFFADKSNFNYTLGKLKNEWAVLSRLKHPNLVRYFDYYRISKSYTLYLIMEYVKGVEMEEYETNRKDEQSFIDYIKEFVGISKHNSPFWKIAIGLFDALAYMHENDIAHRDVKPANILIKSDGEPVLVDYGMACFVNEEIGNDLRCPSKTYSGTVYYLSPEILSSNLRKNDRVVFFTNDVWSAGLSMYEFWFGELYLDKMVEGLKKKEAEKFIIKHISQLKKPIIENPKNLYEEYIDYVLIIPYAERPTAQECLETAEELSV